MYVHSRLEGKLVMKISCKKCDIVAVNIPAVNTRYSDNPTQTNWWKRMSGLEHFPGFGRKIYHPKSGLNPPKPGLFVVQVWRCSEFWEKNCAYLNCTIRTKYPQLGMVSCSSSVKWKRIQKSYSHNM